MLFIAFWNKIIATINCINIYLTIVICKFKIKLIVKIIID